MTIEEKYNKYVDIFYKYFIYDESEDVKGSNIPLEYINFDTKYGFAGDGTINMSYYLQYLYTLKLLGEDNGKIERTLKSLKRLIDGCYDMFVEKNPGIYFKKENGFFLRDDISSSNASNFNLNSIDSSYSRGIEYINEDPCHSAFVSQDQIWNLLPILSILKDEYQDSLNIGREITGYVVNNKHRIYNPYYSAIYHNWTYLHIFEPYWERIEERNENLKYKIKVKRGANNWYFSYGFRKSYNKFGGDCSTFWHSLWYKPFIFLADRVYHPYICKWFDLPVKNTSYYSLAIASGAWYLGNYEKRIIKKFNKSLLEEELFNPQLAFLTSNHNDINYSSLYEWLEKYPEPKEEGVMNSPIMYMILYNWYKLSL